MRKYYMIPTLDRGIFFNNEELQRSICTRSKKIKELEEKRIWLIYNGPIDEDMSLQDKMEYSKVKRLIKEEYKKESYPEYLLVVKELNKYKEISSQKEVKTKQPCFIEVREVKEETFIKYIEENPEYPNTINHFMEKTVKNKVIDFKLAKERLKR